MAVRTWLFVVGLAAALAVGGGAFYVQRLDQPSGAAKAAPSTPRPGVAVETAAVVVDTVVDDIRAFGTLVANESVIVSPEIAGRVAQIRFREADRVDAGTPLVELDSAILKAELDKAHSDVDLATANYERAQTLARQRTGTQRALDEAAASFHAAQANLTLAEARLAKTVITAPFAGVVGFREISEGAYVSPGDRIVQLANIDPLKVEFRVSETYLPNLRIGLPVRVSVDARPDEPMTGEITAIDPIVEVGGRSIRLRARVPNPDGRLSPGLFARIRIVVQERPDAILVPEAAVFQDGGSLFIYRVEGGRAVKTPVTIGQRRPGVVEVRDGLARDAMVVVAGQQLLRDGAAVDVVSGPATGS